MKATARAGQHERMLEPLYPWGCGGGGSHTCSNSQSYPEEMKKWKLPFLQSCADPAHQIPFTSSPARSLSSVSTAGCRSVSPPPICTSRPNTQPNNTYLKKKNQTNKKYLCGFNWKMKVMNVTALFPPSFFFWMPVCLQQSGYVKKT